MSDDKPNVSTADPDDWRTFVMPGCDATWTWTDRPGHPTHRCDLLPHGSVGYHVCQCGNTSASPVNPKPRSSPHTLADCMAAVEDWAAARQLDEPSGLTAAQEIRLRLAEAILADDGIPLVDRGAAFMDRVGQVVVGIATVVEHGVGVPPGWTVEDAKRGYRIDNTPEDDGIAWGDHPAPAPARFDPYANGDGAEAG